MIKCPTCKSEFESEHGMKIHHFRSHGESLAIEESVCSINGCENKFSYYPSEKRGLICPDCVDTGMNIQDTEEYSNISEKLTTYISTECFTCGIDLTVTKTEYSDRVFCSDECISNFQSNRMSGSSNPRYVDGNSSGKVYNSTWRNIRDKVIDRDGGRCIVCNSNTNLHVHHIIPVRIFDRENDAHYMQNAVTVCASCHRDIEYGNVDIPESIVSEHNLEEHSDTYFQKI
jgi:endogenous inhibitor of DNA gyrase (YacG/DUF329 family)